MANWFARYICMALFYLSGQIQAQPDKKKGPVRALKVSTTRSESLKRLGSDCLLVGIASDKTE
jgi:hypothetical protein